MLSGSTIVDDGGEREREEPSPLEKRCDVINDGDNNCGDISDEPVYDMSEYETSTYTCEDGSEVPLSSVNDGTDDC